MAGYYPSQGSQIQPVVYATSSHGHGYPTQYSTSYAQPVQYVPNYSNQLYTTPVVAAPVVVQPTYDGSYYGHHYHHLSFGERLRRFFGLAPRGPFKYKYNQSSWGFMGYSRRPRYADAYTGAEVDRKGRPIYRV